MPPENSAESTSSLNRCSASGTLPLRKPQFQPRDFDYLVPTIMIVKEPGIADPRPPRPPGAGGVPAGGGGGGGPASDAMAKRCPVLPSNAIVRAPLPAHVFRFCSTSKLVALFSLTIVIVPFPWVLNASIVAGLNVAPSEPPASGSLARIVPSLAIMGACAFCGAKDAGISVPSWQACYYNGRT